MNDADNQKRIMDDTNPARLYVSIMETWADMRKTTTMTTGDVHRMMRLSRERAGNPKLSDKARNVAFAMLACEKSMLAGLKGAPSA